MRLFSLLALFIVLLAACAAPTPTPLPTSAPPVTVYADRAFANVLRDIRTAFAQTQPQVQVELVLQDPGALREKLRAAAQPGILLSADAQLLTELQRENRLSGPARPVARDALVLATARANPVNFERVEDLNRPDLRIAVGQDNTPLGNLTAALVENLRTDATYGPDFPALLQENVTVRAADAQAVLQSLMEGRADVGIVPASEVELWKERVRIFEFEPGLRAIDTYTVAQVGTTSASASAQLFFDFLFSPQAETLLEDYGYEAPK